MWRTWWLGSGGQWSPLPQWWVPDESDFGSTRDPEGEERGLYGPGGRSGRKEDLCGPEGRCATVEPGSVTVPVGWW